MNKIHLYSSYFLISIDYFTKKVKIQYVKLNFNSKSYTVIFFIGSNAQELLRYVKCNSILLNYTDRFHYSYLSIELIKAELCLKLNQVYIQS